MTGLTLPAKGRKAFEKLGWLFAEGQKKLWRAAEARTRVADAEAVQKVYVDRAGNTLVATGLMVVQLPPDMKEAKALAFLKKQGFKKISKLAFAQNLYEVQLPIRKPLEEAVAECQASRTYVLAEPAMLQVIPARTLADPGIASQWQHRAIGSQGAWVAVKESE
jgi:hypothetical protein